MIEIARFENSTGSVVVGVEGIKGMSPAIVLDYTVGSGPTERKYDGDSISTATEAMRIYARALSNRERNALDAGRMAREI